MQYLASTWKLWSTEVYGEVKEMTPTRERYVAYKMIEKWLEQGHNAYDIARIWNGGSPVDKQGVNKHGVSYNTREYALKVLARLN